MFSANQKEVPLDRCKVEPVSDWSILWHLEKDASDFTVFKVLIITIVVFCVYLRHKIAKALQ